MDKPLSFSGYKRYTTCPKYYEYHDVKKERPGGQSSALIVGTIVGDVIEDVLMKKSNNPYEGLNVGAVALGKITEYFAHDFDPDLINMKNVEDEAKKLGWKGKDIVKAVKSFLDDQTNLSDNQRIIMNMACNEALRAKMYYMVEGFMKWVYPKIDVVHDVQKHLVSEENDMHGYLDFTCTLKDGRRVLFDIKTASRAYDFDAVLKSPQLALYCAMYNHEYAGFIVLNKTINKQKVKTCTACDVTIKGGNAKKCPTCKKPLEVDMSPKSYVQMLVNKMPERNKYLTTDAMRGTIEAIDKGIFYRNLNQCFYMYGKPCPYVDKCWKGKNK